MKIEAIGAHGDHARIRKHSRENIPNVIAKKLIMSKEHWVQRVNGAEE